MMLLRTIWLDVWYLMVIILSILTVIGIYTLGVSSTLPQVILSVITTVSVDLLIRKLKKEPLKFPASAIISGLFIGTILSESQIFYTPIFAGILAMLSKLVKVKGRHLFNPAAFGLFFSLLLFQTFTGWWSSTNIYAVVILGLFIVWKLKRFHLIVSYLAVFWGLTIVRMILNREDVLSNFNFITNGALLFFTFFMLTEPKTTPTSRNGRIYFGIIAAILTFFLNIQFPQFYLILGLLVADLSVPYLNTIGIKKIKTT